jgi:hypothetical protein
MALAIHPCVIRVSLSIAVGVRSVECRLPEGNCQINDDKRERYEAEQAVTLP